MRQPTRKVSEKKVPKKRKPMTVGEMIKRRSKRKHPEYGTSKLEDKFASEILDKMGVKYTRQFKAEDIGRYYDFYVKTGHNSGILIEVDGSYYHGYGLLHEEKNRMQKHNEYVDSVKDAWALKNKIPLVRIWEHDIRERPSQVYRDLKKVIDEFTEKDNLNENKKKRH